MRYYGQINGNYCGPASAQMILKYLGYNYSENTVVIDGKKRHAPLSQESLARKEFTNAARAGLTAYLPFTRKDGTYSQSNAMTRALNVWTDVPSNYVVFPRPTNTDLKGAALYDIGLRGRPFAGDAVEYVDGITYNNHRVPRISARGHWIVAYGYKSSGSKIKWADPAAVLPSYKASGTAETFWWSTKSMANNHMQSNGVVL